jgi:hypothetical protein
MTQQHSQDIPHAVLTIFYPKYPWGYRPTSSLSPFSFPFSLPPRADHPAWAATLRRASVAHIPQEAGSVHAPQQEVWSLQNAIGFPQEARIWQLSLFCSWVCQTLVFRMVYFQGHSLSLRAIIEEMFMQKQVLHLSGPWRWENRLCA